MSSRLAYTFVAFIMLLLASIVQLGLAIPYKPNENGLGTLESNPIIPSARTSSNHSVKYNASLTDYGSLAKTLKNATPGQLLNFPFNQYKSSLVTLALKALSPSDLATLLSKLSAANRLTILSNLTSSDFATLLSKLSSDDLAIALNYGGTLNGTVVRLLSPADVATVLSKVPASNLATILSKMNSVDFNYTLYSIPSSKIENMLYAVSPAEIENMLYAVSPDALESNLRSLYLIQYLNLTSYQLQHGEDDIAKILNSLHPYQIVDNLDSVPKNKVEYYIKRLSFSLRADVLAVFAGRERLLHPVIHPPLGETGTAGNAGNAAYGGPHGGAATGGAATGRGATGGAATGPGATGGAGGGRYNVPYIPIDPGATGGAGGGAMGGGGYNLPYIHIAEMLAALLIQAPPENIPQCHLTSYSPDDLTNALENLSPSALAKVLTHLPPSDLSTVFNELSANTRTDILNKLPANVRTGILNTVHL